MICNNVLHISPWAISQNLFAGAGRLLRDGGHLFIYGPFKRDGQHTAPSNADFDESLRARNPEWGVRDVGDLETLANDAGLTLADVVPMPSNNLVLVFARTAAADLTSAKTGYRYFHAARTDLRRRPSRPSRTAHA